MKVNPAPLHLAQTVVTGLVIALSIAILGTAAHTLDVFNHQQTSNPWWLPLWPQHFNVRGTKALIASASVTLCLSTIFLVMSLVPKINLANKHTLRVLVAIGAAGPGSLIALVTVIYVHILNHRYDSDSIQTWTCKYRNGTPMQQDMELTNDMGNANFGSLCHQSRFALYGTLIAMLLLGGSMTLSVVGWMADKWSERQTRKEMEMQS